MVVVGLVLIVLGGLAIVSAVFALDIDKGTISYLSIDVSPFVLFLIGVLSAVAILWGFSLAKWGGKRGLARRREEKRLTELSDKLDQVEDRRRLEDDGDDSRGRL
jgi:hypothetical protein